MTILPLLLDSEGRNTFFGMANRVCTIDRNKISVTCVSCAKDNG